MNIIKLITIPICFIAWAILTIAWAIDRDQRRSLMRNPHELADIRNQATGCLPTSPAP
jgi:hypothetical protein